MLPQWRQKKVQAAGKPAAFISSQLDQDNQKGALIMEPQSSALNEFTDKVWAARAKLDRC